MPNPKTGKFAKGAYRGRIYEDDIVHTISDRRKGWADVVQGNKVLFRDALGDAKWYDASDLYALRSKAAKRDAENERLLAERTMRQTAPPQDFGAWYENVKAMELRPQSSGQDFGSWLKDVRAMKLMPSNSVAQWVQPTVEDISDRMSQMHVSGFDASVQPPWPKSSSNRRPAAAAQRNAKRAVTARS